MELRRRWFITRVPLALLFVPTVAAAQPSGRIPRIGWLGLGAPTPATTKVSREPFLNALRERGWVEGRDFVVEIRHGDGNPDRLPRAAAELVAARVDVIVAANHSAIDAAVKATTTIPIVMGIGSDPVGMGWVKSLARPGSNVTGVASIITPELSGKRLEILREALPKVSTVGVLWWPEVRDPVPLWKALQEPGRRLGVALRSLPVHSAEEIEHAFEIAKREKVHALMVQGDIFLFQHRHAIIRHAAAHAIPTGYAWATYVEAGGLLSYGAEVPEFFRRAADYVDRILKGAKPAELPIEQPRKFELAVNLKTAKALGLTIAPSVLLRADRVIE